MWFNHNVKTSAKRMFVISFALTAAACAPSLAIPSLNDHDGEPASYSIAGTAILHESSSHHITCEDVLLVKATPQVIAKISAVFGGEGGGYAAELKVGGYTEIAEQQNRVAYKECGGDGAFILSHVKPAEYYVIARTTWLLRWAHRGGYLARRIQVTRSMTDIRLEKKNS
jgi:hypothetical protein